ncbi:cysteine desulfurase family protein [uncultured Eudoraea sp.]|jgi:cysteine desulfurase|uniref:cysteine desulfurase family protein n=1 Tax=uncultured Eudoraea sp. TaxID=1035614 RepID=UPI0026075251|nr:cysteine desulfurase family protein [uncultured Eudoraea sp.]
MNYPLYLDYNATTPCDQDVVDSMLPYFSVDFGNASSEHHPYGWLAKEAIEDATLHISSLLKIDEKEIIYTSGSTESINAVLKGVYRKLKHKGNQILTVKTEHKATLDVCEYLQEEGADVTYLDVDGNGVIDLNALALAISDNTLIVSVMYANNETGVIQPLEAIAKICKQKNTLLFSDATQALGKIPLNNFFSWVDFACFSAHKIYGPKGIGFTFAKLENQASLQSFIQGGGQQRKLRGGTYNTPAIVGMAKAINLGIYNLEAERDRLSNLRNQLEKGLSLIEEATINGKKSDRLCNTLNISFEYVDGQQLLAALSRNIAVSNGSACNSAAINPSHVLTAMGIGRNLALSTLRISLGKYTTEEDIQQAILIITKEVAKQRASNLLWDRR